MSDQPTVLLTGASAGIGLAALQVLVKQAFVVGVSRTPPPLSHPNARWVQGDLRSPEEVVANIQAWLEDARRPLDGLIHCAVSYGADGRHGFLQTRDGEWDEVMAVNVRSPFVLTLRLLPVLLRRPRAFIVSLTSDTATRPAPQRIAYGCSKAACHSLFSGLAEELADSAVSVIQMMPRRQVITRGIRGRRPPDFQFEGYDRPQIFDEPFTTILASRGAGMNGQCLIVG